MPTRKQVLSGAAALALSPGVAAAAGFTDRITRHLPDADQVWEWQKQLAAWAPCLTASPSHNAFVDWLGSRLQAAGIEPRRQSFRLPYWELHSYGLWLAGERVHTTGYRPYSGTTGPSGLTAEMHYAGTVPNLDLSAAAGKIVLMDIPPSAEPGRGPENSVLFSAFVTPDQALLAKAGAVAVIYIWNGFSDANVQWQMEPFYGPPTRLPALWVNQATGARLKAAAKGARLRFVLDATDHPDTRSDTVWGVLPGASDEVVIVNTHTDGCNANEENGGLAVVSLAWALSRLPQAERRKTYVFLMTTGHFSQGYIMGADEWKKANPELMGRAVACLTCEHLGARDWRDVGGVYKDTGRFVLGRGYTWTKSLAQVFTDAAAATGAPEMSAIDPKAPGQKFYGEGSPFYRAGVPTVGYIPLPEYLMAQPPKGGDIDKLDKARLRQEMVVFARTLERIDAMTKAELLG